MDRLAHASRLIADIRLGADRLLEALLLVGEQPHRSGVNKPLHLIIQEGASMRQYLQDLRTVGRQLEDSGVFNESLRSISNSWGLHMPLVCPDDMVLLLYMHGNDNLQVRLEHLLLTEPDFYFLRILMDEKISKRIQVIGIFFLSFHQVHSWIQMLNVLFRNRLS